MSKLSRPMIYLALSASLLGSPASSQSSNQWRITPDQANCILENLQSYAAQSQRLVVIAVENCPETDLFANALTGRKNTGLATPMIQTGRKTSRYDKFISYTLQQIGCLKPDMVEYRDGVALLPKNVPCS